MIKDTPEGQTNYCTHREDHDIGECDICLPKKVKERGLEENANYVHVGDTIQCGHCQLEIFKSVLKNCECVCHSKKPYNQIDHYHCFEQDNPPCGQKIEHYKCCICEMLNPKTTENEESWKIEFGEMFRTDNNYSYASSTSNNYETYDCYGVEFTKINGVHYKK